MWKPFATSRHACLRRGDLARSETAVSYCRGYFVCVPVPTSVRADKRSYQQMELVLTLTRGEDSASRADSLVEAARIRNGFDTLIVADTGVSSKPSFTVERVPKRLLCP